MCQTGLKPVSLQQAKSPLGAQTCMPVFHQLVAETGNEMTEGGEMMEEVLGPVFLVVLPVHEEKRNNFSYV